ncbi:MAG: ribosome-binding factor A [Patescibacteria group bacterium]|nr:ribosome-binding factor A [Patescibacteria group bacterium]MDE2116423.1 ribosome-binding factor A [Patescibacteria group bacterium]
MSIKHDRFEEILKHLAAEFLKAESNRTSLITITRVSATEKGDFATIYFTVLPENKEEAALDFLKRQRSAFRDYAKDHARLMRVPFFDFEIDRGERARQRIDESLAR